MVHNGIEYGLMAAYAEGFNLLREADAGTRAARVDAETAPLTVHGTHLAYNFDLAAIAELWRHGSVVSSWLLDLVGAALARNPSLDGFLGEVADSGEGRWTVSTAIDAGVPVPVLATALFARFSSRNHDDFANRLLSAMRREFGGHIERTGAPAK
jgi:6-phosphogluconate dehydrogenase